MSKKTNMEEKRIKMIQDVYPLFAGNVIAYQSPEDAVVERYSVEHLVELGLAVYLNED